MSVVRSRSPREFLKRIGPDQTPKRQRFQRSICAGTSRPGRADYACVQQCVCGGRALCRPRLIYKLSCEGRDKTSIDLRAEVEKALMSMPYEAIADPTDDWFEAVVDRVCAQTGYVRVAANGAYDIEDDYFAEVKARRAESYAEWRREAMKEEE